jgi:DNA-binding NtrC family response regulator
MVERLAILCGEDGIELADLPASLAERSSSTATAHAIPAYELPAYELPAEGLSLYRAVGELEKSLISQALSRTGWNKNQAAQLLDLNRTTLIEKIKKRELTPPD